MLQKIEKILLFCVCLFSISMASGQEIKLQAAIERDSIWLGDQIKLLLVAEKPSGVKIDFPQTRDTIAGNVEILKRSFIDSTALDNARLQLKQAYIITCFDSGPHFIPPFYFKVQQNGSTDSLKTNSLTLFVKVPDVDLKKGIADIKKPFEAPVTFKEIAPWVLGIILAGAIIFLIVYMISRRRKNLPLFQRPEKPRLPAHIIAFQDLEKLKEEQLWQHDKIKDYYTRLTDILRVYVEDRFNISAMEQTTYEILLEFRERKLLTDSHSYDSLKDILQLADLVKFAKLSPLPDDNHKCFDEAWQFVEHTKIEESAESVKAEEEKEKPKKELVTDLSEKEGKEPL